MGFDIKPDVSEKDVTYDIHENNFFHDFVKFSRSNQVLNEEQASLVMMAVATGMMQDYEFYTSVIVTGSASSGKSHMLDNVNFAAFEYANDVHDYIYEMTGSSDQGGINDDDIDDARAAYFHELQKIPDEMLEFIKTVAEDGQFIYGRSTADPDADGGYSTEKFSRDPLPVIFSFADENTAASGKDQELRSRTVEIKVDESPEKNKGVHDMKWGGEKISLPDNDNEYITSNPDLDHAVKAHIRDMPIGVDVVLPYGVGKFDGDDWCAADVVRPMFNFDAADSTRASANVAGLTMGSAICNYHARDAVCEGCQSVYGPSDAQKYSYECPECDDEDLYIVASPVDVSNIIMCRPTLLATTHGLTEKKFDVLDAILARGGRANASGTAVQATEQDIIEQIKESDDVGTMTKPEIKGILEDLDEELIVNKTDNPQDKRENLYIYDGGSVFQPPNIFDYYDKFADISDPIRDQPIEQTIEQQLDDLNAKMDMDDVTATEPSSSKDDESGLEKFEDDGGDSHSDLSDDAQRVAQALEEQLDGEVVQQRAFEESRLKTSHMVGDSPTEYTDDGLLVPSREPRHSDRLDGFMDPDKWDEGSDFEATGERIDNALLELREAGVLQFDESAEGGFGVAIET